MNENMKLEQKWYYVATLVNDQEWTHPDNISAEAERIWDGMMRTLSVMVWGTTRKTVQYPKTWIDAFKLRWYPKWAIERWPAAIMTIRLDEVLPMLSTKDSSIRSSIAVIEEEGRGIIIPRENM